ncbi:MAG: aminotransferase class V-fold PLP-dependent enzyme [Clostridia bacterium]|nr:aminotransferase class V-fold PLP-dependent enzyme [Clostridia bacterium]
MIYLDNASTTNYKPQRVIDAVVECLTKYPFNPHRGGKVSLELQQKMQNVRQKLALLCNNPSAQVVFTSGCTEALNLAILGCARRGHIILSATEHNSVLRPVVQLKNKGIVDFSVVQPDHTGQITVESLQKALRKDTYMLIINQASNVTGTAQNLRDIGAFARSNNLLFLCDCAQSMGYFPTDMVKNNIDLLAIAGHKGLHAMQGVGALIFNNRAIPRPIKFGGTGTESHNLSQPTTLPDGLESGTPASANILSLGAGIDWWLDTYKQSAENISYCQRLLLDGLQAIPNVKLYSTANKSGIVAFNVGEMDSNVVCDHLADKYNVITRGGLHCAPLMHQYLGTTNQGIVRASVSCVTTKQDCFALLNAIQNLVKMA